MWGAGSMRRLRCASPGIGGVSAEADVTTDGRWQTRVAQLTDDHSRHSSLREAVIEHQFIAALTRSLWITGCRDFEVLHSMVDNRGYDLAAEAQGVLRYIQLKASFSGAKTKRQSINTALVSKPNGCVIWLIFDKDTLDLRQFLWFGAEPGGLMPDLGSTIARHTKGNRTGEKTARPDIRVLTKGAFTPLATIEDVARRLFDTTA